MQGIDGEPCVLAHTAMRLKHFVPNNDLVSSINTIGNRSYSLFAPGNVYFFKVESDSLWHDLLMTSQLVLHSIKWFFFNRKDGECSQAVQPISC